MWDIITFIFRTVQASQIIILTKPQCTEKGARTNNGSIIVDRQKRESVGLLRNIELDQSENDNQLKSMLLPVYFYVKEKNGTYNEELTKAFLQLWTGWVPNNPQSLIYETVCEF